LFGEGGGARVAKRYDVPFLGGIPLLRAVREGGDAGCPVARSEPDGEVGLAFLDLARKMATAMPAREVGHA
jgi:ATP-binding protein involved in chromosome partitioning